MAIQSQSRPVPPMARFAADRLPKKQQQQKVGIGLQRQRSNIMQQRSLRQIEGMGWKQQLPSEEQGRQRQRPGDQILEANCTHSPTAAEKGCELTSLRGALRAKEVLSSIGPIAVASAVDAADEVLDRRRVLRLRTSADVAPSTGAVAPAASSGASSGPQFVSALVAERGRARMKEFLQFYKALPGDLRRRLDSLEKQLLRFGYSLFAWPTSTQRRGKAGARGAREPMLLSQWELGSPESNDMGCDWSIRHNRRK